MSEGDFLFENDLVMEMVKEGLRSVLRSGGKTIIKRGKYEVDVFEHKDSKEVRISVKGWLT